MDAKQEKKENTGLAFIIIGFAMAVVATIIWGGIWIVNHPVISTVGAGSLFFIATGNNIMKNAKKQTKV